MLDTVDEEDIHGRKQLLQVLERESQMLSTQLDKTIDENDVAQRISQIDEDEETMMHHTKGSFKKYDEADKQKYQTMTSWKGHERLALTNMNKSSNSKMDHKNQSELVKR